MRFPFAFGNRVCERVVGFAFVFGKRAAEQSCVFVCGWGDCQDQAQRPQVPRPKIGREDLSYKTKTVAGCAFSFAVGRLPRSGAKASGPSPQNRARRPELQNHCRAGARRPELQKLPRSGAGFYRRAGAADAPVGPFASAGARSPSLAAFSGSRMARQVLHTATPVRTFSPQPGQSKVSCG